MQTSKVESAPLEAAWWRWATKIHNGNQGCRPRQCCYLKRKQANTNSELVGLLNWLGFGRFDVEKAHKTMLAAYQNKNIALSAWLDGHMVVQAEFELLNGTHKGVWIFRLFLFLWTVAALRSCPNNSCPNYWSVTLLGCSVMMQL